MCWLVLHCRPGLVRDGQAKERAAEKHLKGINAQHSASPLSPSRLAMEPQSHHSPLTITSASAVPTTYFTSQIHHVLPSPPIGSPATPRPKTKRLDTRSVLPDWRSARDTR